MGRTHGLWCRQRRGGHEVEVVGEVQEQDVVEGDFCANGGGFWDLSGPAVDAGHHRKRAWACVRMDGWVGMCVPDTGLCGAARCKRYDVELLIAVE